MPFLVLLVVMVVVVVLVIRAAAASGSGAPGGGTAARRPRATRPARATGPDDDPDFLRELARRVRRDDGAPG